MKISSKGRYALRILVELAENEERLLSLNELATRQDISVKYLEHIISKLCKKGIVVGYRGVTGGYKLAKDPSDITVAEILEVTEGDLNIVDCLGKDTNCERASVCKTKLCWQRLNNTINDYLKSVTLKDILQ